jgi:hypothetical protein
MPGKHALDTKKPMKFKKRKIKPVVEGSGEDILLQEVKALLRKNDTAEQEDEEERIPGFKRFDEVEVDIVELSSLGRNSFCRYVVIDLSGDGMGVV